MDDLRLRELVRPLADAIQPASSMKAQRNMREGFRDDGSLERRVIAGVLPLQRLDWIVEASAAAGLRTGRYYLPEAATITRIAMVSTSNVAATFDVDVLVNGVVKASSAIRTGNTAANGVVTVALPAGSVVSVESKTSIAQGVTVSVFYRPVED